MKTQGLSLTALDLYQALCCLLPLRSALVGALGNQMQQQARWKRNCLLLMVAGFCLQPLIFFLLFQAQGGGQTDKHPDSCWVLSNWKSHITGPCFWRGLGHRGA